MKNRNNEIFNWVSSFNDIDSRGLDSNRRFVQDAISAWRKKDNFGFIYKLKTSGLDKNGIVYFAMREYFGEEEEICFWLDLRRFFNNDYNFDFYNP